MSRNMPYRRVAHANGHVFYAWMYAPEANATAETWTEVFGDKEAAVPALYDGVRMPDGLVRVVMVVFVANNYRFPAFLLRKKKTTMLYIMACGYVRISDILVHAMFLCESSCRPAIQIIALIRLCLRAGHLHECTQGSKPLLVVITVLWALYFWHRKLQQEPPPTSVYGLPDSLSTVLCT